MRGAADDGRLGIGDTRAGHVVFLRTPGQGGERAEAMTATLPKRPRLP